MNGVIKMFGRLYGALFKLCVLVVTICYIEINAEPHFIQLLIICLCGICWIMNNYITSIRLDKLEEQSTDKTNKGKGK